MRKILVTTALVYANGPMHLGHILEQIQADIWVRWQKLQGQECLLLCGDDAHGTPIMISAQQQKITPEELIAQTKTSHAQDAAGFLIEFDNYYTTHSEENRALTNAVYHTLQQNNDLETKVIEQAFDPEANLFLPDRYIKGTCPHCGAKEQYGDNCERCGAIYSPTELISPISIISGQPPIAKKSEHYFFRLNKYRDSLKSWGNSSLPPEITNKLNEWFQAGLKPWDISRDHPYFGFPIPHKPGKYFYVWLDAPLGYIATLKNLAAHIPSLNWHEYWQEQSTTELYHFIGKDIVYFHALFWPAILESIKMRKPTKLFTHGYLTINGYKMSKSRGTFILAQNYLNHLDPEYLRYYLAAKSSSSIEDIDLNFTDFVQRINSDLVGKVVNIASRSAKFITQNFAHMLADSLDAPELFTHGITQGHTIAALYEKRAFNSAVRTIMQFADLANQYIDEKKPWHLAKTDPHDLHIQKICTTGLNLFYQLIIFLKPILPRLAARTEQFLQLTPLTWKQHTVPLLNHKIAKFTPLMQRVDPQKVAELLSL